MADIVVTLTVEQMSILSNMAIKTNRTSRVLLENYLTGFIESLREEAFRTSVESEFFKLSFADKARAVDYVKREVK